MYLMNATKTQDVNMDKSNVNSNVINYTNLLMSTTLLDSWLRNVISVSTAVQLWIYSIMIVLQIHY